MSSLQKRVYRGILERDYKLLVASGKDRARPNLRNMMMELRKCADHPFLLPSVVPPFSSEGEWLPRMIGASGKMAVLHLMLKHLKANGHRSVATHVPCTPSRTCPCLRSRRPSSRRCPCTVLASVLIFSQFVIMLDLLETYLRSCAYAFERLDGSTSQRARQAAIDAFNGARGDTHTDVPGGRRGRS